MDRRMSIQTRKLKNGRTAYDVKLRTPDGHQYSQSFRTRKEAEAFQTKQRATRMEGVWVDPTAGRITFGSYAERWLAQRVGLRPRSRELYDYILRHHLLPTFAEVQLKAITVARVRAWHAELHEKRSIGPSTVAKAYRLLRTIMATAVEDELISRNPCLVKGASVEHHEERPVATVAQVAALADAVQPHYRAMVLLATWCGLRFGELTGLTRADLDPTGRTVRVARQAQELKDGSRVVGPPKTDAGRRTVAVPPHIFSELRKHLALWVAAPPESLAFGDSEGGPLRRSNFSRRVWQPACRGGRVAGLQVPRPQTYREHPGGVHRRQHQGADEPHGPRQPSCRPDLPARHLRARPGAGRGPLPAGRTR